MVAKHIYLFSLLAASGCILYSKKAPLQYSLQEGKMAFLRVDGYYYLYETYQYQLDKKWVQDKATHVYLLYGNGVAVNMNNYPGWVEEETIEQNILNPAFSDIRRKDRLGWGVMKVAEDSSLTFNHWSHDSSGHISAMKSGKIIDDTTFVFTEYRNITGRRNIRVLTDTFHFRHFLPKPDSTTQFFQY